MKTAMSNVVFKCVVINKINCRTVQCGRVVIGLPLKGYRLLLATTTQCHIYTLPTTNRQTDNPQPRYLWCNERRKALTKSHRLPVL